MATEPQPKKKTVSLKDIKTGIEHDLGARLTTHLIGLKNQFGKDSEIHQLASRALKGDFGGERSVGQDVLSNLGKKLKDVRHDLGKAYNWDRMYEGIQTDKAVKDYIQKRVAGNHGTGLFRKTAEQFASVLGLHKNKSTTHDDFWQGLRDHVTKTLGNAVNKSHLSDERLYRSIRRNAHTEDDVTELQNMLSKNQNTKEAKQFKESLGYVPAKAPTVKGIRDKKGVDSSNIESYSRQLDFVLKFEKCTAHKEYIDEQKANGKNIEEIKEGLEHTFHLDDSEAAKALIKYGMPDHDTDYSDEYQDSLTNGE